MMELMLYLSTPQPLLMSATVNEAEASSPPPPKKKGSLWHNIGLHAYIFSIKRAYFLSYCAPPPDHEEQKKINLL